MRFMLMQDYGGVESGVPLMSAWKAEEVEAHIAFQRRINDELTERGEMLGGHALTAPELAKFVVVDPDGETVVTDGPYPESKELLAGFRLVDVESQERALEIAAEVSAAPGPGGAPIRQRIEVREVMADFGPEE